MTKVCFRSELRNYTIYINSFCKLDAVWPCQARGQRLFSGGKFTEVSVWRADCHPDNSNYNNTNTCWVKVFCRWQTLLFGQKCDKDSRGQAGGQTGGQTLLHVQLQYFFLHISYQRRLQLPVTGYMLLWSQCEWGRCVHTSRGRSTETKHAVYITVKHLKIRQSEMHSAC